MSYCVYTFEGKWLFEPISITTSIIKIEGIVSCKGDKVSKDISNPSSDNVYLLMSTTQAHFLVNKDGIIAHPQVLFAYEGSSWHLDAVELSQEDTDIIMNYARHYVASWPDATKDIL